MASAMTTSISARPPRPAFTARRRLAPGADRLVRERGEDQQRRADDDREHADVEERRARQVHIAEERQQDVRGVGREEGIAERHRAGPVTTANSSPTAIQRSGFSVTCASTHCVPATSTA